MEFEKPTPQQRIAELREVAGMMGNPPSSIIFNGDGLVKSSIGIPLSFSQYLVIPDSQSEINTSGQRGSEGKSEKHNKVQPSMKANQKRHSQNLSEFSGWYKGKHYVNGQPMERKESNTNRNKKNGNGRH